VLVQSVLLPFSCRIKVIAGVGSVDCASRCRYVDFHAWQVMTRCMKLAARSKQSSFGSP